MNADLEVDFDTGLLEDHIRKLADICGEEAEHLRLALVKQSKAKLDSTANASMLTHSQAASTFTHVHHHILHVSD